MKKINSNFLMITLVMIWTLDVLTVSSAVEDMNQIFVLFCKYASAFLPMLLFVKYTEGIIKPNAKDIPILVFSSVLGDLCYFYFEYTALKYASGALVTIMLGFLPIASLVVETIMNHDKLSKKVFLEICMTIIGVVMILWAQIGRLDKGTIIAVICCIAGVSVWVLYGIVVNKLNNNYSSAQISLYQMIAALIMMAPIALTHLPTKAIPTSTLLFQLVFMGILSSGIGVLIEVKGLVDLGLTVSGVFLNILPVTTAIMEYFIYGKRLTLFQTVGFVIVIVFSILVIKEQESEKK